MTTIETITDEQILELLDYALYAEWHQTAACCYTALHGVHLNAHRRRQRPRYSKTDPRYRAARAFCVRVWNDHSERIAAARLLDIEG